jgi:hypothetical protein
VVEAVSPAEPVKSEKVEQTKPVEKLSDQEIQELTSKQAQYCLQINEHLPEPKLSQEIEVCEQTTSSWTIEEFDALLAG